MYLYEEMDLNELLDSPEIDPDSAEALYAIAQCYRLGRGTDVNEALYRSNLEAAAQAGSEQAQQELASASAPAVQETAEVQAADLPLYQQRRLAEQGDPAAILQMVHNSLAVNDTQAALLYLQRAEKFVADPVYTREQKQDIFLQLGELYAHAPLEDAKKSAQYYGMASELGSAQAALVLAQYARTGYGCSKDEVQADSWIQRAAECGDMQVKYDLALQLAESKPVYAASLLDEVVHSVQEGPLHARAKVMLAKHSGELTAEDIEDAWIVYDAPEIAELLLNLYAFPVDTSDPEVPEGMTLHALRFGGDGMNVLIPEGVTDYGFVNGLVVNCGRAEWLSNHYEGWSRCRLWAECAVLFGSKNGARWVEADNLCEQGITLLKQDPAQAVSFLQKAAEQGNARAMYQLGLCLCQGTGVEKNEKEAERWMYESAQTGYAEAERLYAGLFLPGTLDSNPEKREWFEQAAQGGSVLAMFDLCGSKQPGDALQQLKDYAENGNVEAQRQLAWCYLEARGTERNDAEGIKWLKEAAGHRPEGRYDLKRENPLAYAYSAAVIADYMLRQNMQDGKQIFFWAKEAYDVHQASLDLMAGPAGISFAAQLATCYQEGLGTEVNTDRAIELYKSADARYEYVPTSWVCLGLCYLHGTGVQKDLAEARRYFEMARKEGHNVGQNVWNELTNAENAAARQREAEQRQQAEAAAAQERRQSEEAKQHALDGEFERCAQYILAWIVVSLLAGLFGSVRVPLVGEMLVTLLQIARLAFAAAFIVKAVSLYPKAGGNFFSRLVNAFTSECGAFAQAVAGLFGGKNR